MPEQPLTRDNPVPLIYVTDLSFANFDPSDLFDLAFILRSPTYNLLGVCLADPHGDGERVLTALGHAARHMPTILSTASELVAMLERQEEPVSLVVVGGFSLVAAVLERERALFRKSVGRVFVVGGYANDYGEGAPRSERKLPVDPRVEQRNPDRFQARGDPRLSETETVACAAILASGEAVIWLPRDVSLWRYAAPQVLEDGGPLTEFLRRELWFANFVQSGTAARYAAADMPALLSTLPALLLAARPDPAAWMRLFRVDAARIEVGGNPIVELHRGVAEPNAYVVVAIDGVALGKLITEQLRDRPMAAV